MAASYFILSCYNFSYRAVEFSAITLWLVWKRNSSLDRSSCDSESSRCLLSTCYVRGTMPSQGNNCTSKTQLPSPRSAQRSGDVGALAGHGPLVSTVGGADTEC